MDDVCEIAEIMGRTGGRREVAGGPEALRALRVAYSQLQEEKEKAADYFARKRVEDIRALEANIAGFEADLDGLKANFAEHGPFTLSWKSREALAELEVVLGKAAELRSREGAMREDAAALGMERAPSAALVAFERRVRQVCVVWEVEGEWEAFQQNLLSQPAAPAPAPAGEERVGEDGKCEDRKASLRARTYLNKNAVGKNVGYETDDRHVQE